MVKNSEHGRGLIVQAMDPQDDAGAPELTVGGYRIGGGPPVFFFLFFFPGHWQRVQ